MSACSQCGSTLVDPSGHCTFHTLLEDGWAANNKAMCDYIHRGVEPKRLTQQELDESANLIDLI